MRIEEPRRWIYENNMPQGARINADKSKQYMCIELPSMEAAEKILFRGLSLGGCELTPYGVFTGRTVDLYYFIGELVY